MSVCSIKSRCRTGGGIEGYSLNTGQTAYSAGDLSGMTVVQVKSLASNLGYSITETRKADIIAEFLSQQGV